MAQNFLVGLDESKASLVPSDCWRGGEGAVTELIQKSVILIEHVDVLCERGDIRGSMDKSIFHVYAKFGTSVGNQGNASAAYSFRANQAKTFLDAGQNHNVALAHDFGDVLSMTQNADAGMGKA